jgi:SynChlorMet cassette protein ScmD
VTAGGDVAGRRLLANPDCVLREESDEWGVLFNPDTGQACGVNPSGIAVWRALDGRRTVAEVEGRVLTAFPEAPPEAADEIRSFVDELISGGFAIVVE